MYGNDENQSILKMAHLIHHPVTLALNWSGLTTQCLRAPTKTIKEVVELTNHHNSDQRMARPIQDFVEPQLPITSEDQLNQDARSRRGPWFSLRPRHSLTMPQTAMTAYEVAHFNRAKAVVPRAFQETRRRIGADRHPEARPVSMPTGRHHHRRALPPVAYHRTHQLAQVFLNLMRFGPRRRQAGARRRTQAVTPEARIEDR